MNYFEGLDDEKLLERFGVTYGKLVFDPDNKNLLDSIGKCKSEILARINKNNNTEAPLYNLITEENVVSDKYGLDEVVSKLIKTVKPSVYEPSVNARILILMDNSGSMGSFEKYMSKSFMLWNEKLLKESYMNVQKYFVSFNTQAYQIDSEDEFYSKGESGGTILSTGLNKVYEIINSYDYNYDDTYIFIISDGDNLTSDNERVVRIINDIQRKVRHICYFETNQYSRHSTLMTGFKNISFNNFSKHIIRTKDELLDILKELWATIGK